MLKEIKTYIISNDNSVRDAMKQLNLVEFKILFIVDDNNKLIGSLSDGDIRRWILEEGFLDAELECISNPNPFFVEVNFNNEDLRKIIEKEKYVAVPVCDKNKEIVDIIFLNHFIEKANLKVNHEKLDVDVVIMAGGKGTRLEPFTKILPKPLIPIGDKTIIEIIIEKFTDYKINNFYVSVNHKAKIIKSYFEELKREYTVSYIEENQPLGTIGALSLMKGKFTKPILITNCDIIINTDYSEFLKFHISNKYDLSLIGSMMDFNIPYGVCEIGKDGILENFTEKPQYSILASTGMYLISPSIIDQIPENVFYDITDLMTYLRNNGGRIGVFPISEESWMDTGEWDQYRKTVSKLKL